MSNVLKATFTRDENDGKSMKKRKYELRILLRRYDLKLNTIGNTLQNFLYKTLELTKNKNFTRKWEAFFMYFLFLHYDT